MELRQLRYFVMLAEERHFGRAAERLHIAQPGLSQQIRALEGSVGAVLFDRDARPVALTEAGERFLPHARAVVEAAARAGEAVRAHRPQPGLVLKVGITAIGDYPEFAKLIEVFADRQPEVEVRILPSMPDAILQSLGRRTLDVGVIHQPLDWPEGADAPRYLRLGEQEVLVVLPADHPLARRKVVERRDLLEERVIGIPQHLAPKFTEHVTRTLFGVFPHPKVVDHPEAVDRDARFRMVAEGRGLTGIAVPAGSELPPDRGGLAFRRVANPPALIEYGLVWLDVNGSLATRPFVDVARELQDTAL